MSYTIGVPHPAHEVACTHTRSEIHPGNTVTFTTEIDLSEIEAVRAHLASRGTKPSYTSFVVKAAAIALRDFPYANRRIVRRRWLPFLRARMQQFENCDIAVACERDMPGVEVATFMDVVRSADKKNLTDLTQWLRDLARCDETNNRQWRDFKWMVTHLPPSLTSLLMQLQVDLPSWWEKYRGAALLVSSPAKYGVDVVTTTWPWPLGVSFGLVKQRAVVRDGQVVARPTFTLTLNFDRRIMAAAQAARVFNRLVQALEHAWLELADALPQPKRGTARFTKEAKSVASSTVEEPMRAV